MNVLFDSKYISIHLVAAEKEMFSFSKKKKSVAEINKGSVTVHFSALTFKESVS